MLCTVEELDRCESYPGDWRDWIEANPGALGTPRDWDHRPVEPGLIEEGTHRCRLRFGPLNDSEAASVDLHAEPLNSANGPRRRVSTTLFLPCEGASWDLDILQTLGINHPKDLAGLLNGAGAEIHADVEIWIELQRAGDVNLMGEISRVRRANY